MFEIRTYKDGMQVKPRKVMSQIRLGCEGLCIRLPAQWVTNNWWMGIYKACDICIKSPYDIYYL